MINNLLLIILIILILFCILTYLYTNGDITTILSHDNFDNVADNKLNMLQLMTNAKQNAQKILKERFLVDERQIIQNDAINYLNSVNAVQSWLDNTYKGEYGIMDQIKADVQKVSESRNYNKQQLLELFTNIFVISYINLINKQNAESYKMYLKYNKPIQNKYYSQYLM